MDTTQPVADLLDLRLPAVQRSYLIDPSTGSVTSLGPIRVVPEPGAAAFSAMVLCVTFLARPRGPAGGVFITSPTPVTGPPL